MSKIALICRGYKSLAGSDDLKYLDHGVDELCTILDSYWNVQQPHILSDTGALKKEIDKIGEAFDEFLFYYIGHGKVENHEFYIVGEDNDRINLKDILLLTEKWNKKVTIVLDACHSGQFINQWENKINYEIMTSTDTSYAYEDPVYKMSFFTYHFCKTIRKNQNHVQYCLEDIYEDIHENLATRQKCSHHRVKEFGRTSNIISSNPEITKISDSLDEPNPRKTLTKTNQIFLIFNQDNLSEISYTVTGYIQCEDEFDSETIEFKFENIYDTKEQEAFIKLLVDEFDSDITIHFILPHTLFLVNFKLWEYRGTPLVNRYHILLHNKENYESKIRKYSNMISSWTTLYESIKTDKICNTLLSTDNDERFDTRLNKMGIYFQHEINCNEKIINALDIAKVGLWQYKDGCIVEFGKWIDKESLDRLEEESRNCNHMALVWDDMRLLKDLKEFKIRVKNG